MSETVTYSVKLDADIKERLTQNIAASGLTAGDFITRLLENYTTEQERASLSQTEIRELNQLRYFLARIEEIYVAMAKSRQDVEMEYKDKLDAAEQQAKQARTELLEAKEDARRELEQASAKVAAYEQQVSELRAQTQAELNEMRQFIKQAELSREQAEKLAEMAQKNAHTLEAQLAALTAKLAEVERLNATLRQDLAHLSEQYTNVQTEHSQLEQALAHSKQQLEYQSQLAAQQLAEYQSKAEIMQEKAVLTTQREYLLEIKQLQDQLADLQHLLFVEREEKAAAVAELRLLKTQQNS